MNNKSRTQSRRLFLRGAGTVAVALPFMEEFAPKTAIGAPGDPPTRVVTAFFGLGLYPEWQQERFNGPLAPYQSLQDKIAFFTNVNMNQGEGGAHCENSPVVFVGEKNPGENLAGGASIDQLVRQEHAPNSPVLVSGLWWRRGACDAQALRVWNADGTARPPIKRPSEVFDRIFGTYTPPVDPGTMTDPEVLRQQHIKRSILDTVMGQYQSLSSNRSKLGTDSRQKLELHLQSIREIELQLAPADQAMQGADPVVCNVPNAPSDPDINADYDKFTHGTGTGAPEVTYQDFQMVYRLHADLWVAALRCDLVRYGNLAFESAGGHTNFDGTYSALGESTNFPDHSQHDSYFHDGKHAEARLYQHFAQENIAYFLSQLEAETEENGKTMLDNTTVVIGTEYGKNHSSNGVFHAIAGGTDKFKSGFYTNQVNAIDVYNAVLEGHGINGNIGNATSVASEGDASAVLA